MPTDEQKELMLYGLVGQFAKIGAFGKGLNPIAIALAFMTWLSAALSPRIIFKVADTLHTCRIYAVHVGRSARGGKGDSMSLLNRVIEAIDFNNPGLIPMQRNGGLSTREGLAMQVHDSYKDNKQDVPPILDKRLSIVESEFVKILALAKKDPGLILPVIRELWDFGGSIIPLTKTNPISATRPHMTLYGNITPYELRATLDPKDIHGGTVNRFLFIFAEREEMIAFPSTTSTNDVNQLAAAIADVIRWSKQGYGSFAYNASQDQIEIGLSAEARDFWEITAFPRLSKPFGNELVAEATNRRAPFALRLALLFAITDKSLIIEKHHLEAGVAWVDASAQTAKFLFGNQTKAIAVNKVDKKKLIDFLLANNGQATRTEISSKCFHRKRTKSELDTLLNGLCGSVIDKHEQVAGNGQKTSIYKLA
jgi:hypothetical protein